MAISKKRSLYSLAAEYERKKTLRDSLDSSLAELRDAIISRVGLGVSVVARYRGSPKLVVDTNHVKQTRLDSTLLKLSDPDTYRRYKTMVVEFDTIRIRGLSDVQ